MRIAVEHALAVQPDDLQCLADALAARGLLEQAVYPQRELQDLAHGPLRIE
ncbi:hypothetical protein D3C72_2273300 [compost metagenome]